MSYEHLDFEQLNGLNRNLTEKITDLQNQQEAVQHEIRRRFELQMKEFLDSIGSEQKRRLVIELDRQGYRISGLAPKVGKADKPAKDNT